VSLDALPDEVRASFIAPRRAVTAVQAFPRLAADDPEALDNSS